MVHNSAVYALEDQLDQQQFERLEQRIGVVAPQQCRAKVSVRKEDPITGRRVLINQLRAARHFEVSGDDPPKITRREDCLFCTGRTPSTLFYFDECGKLVVADEENSIEAANEFWRQPGKDPAKLTDHYGLVGSLGAFTLPANWQTRTFFNLTPSLGENEPGNCYVTTVHPDYHYRDLPDMPTSVFDNVLASWAVLEKLALNHGLAAVPFINGGRRKESGQSVSCFHSQTYIMQTPELYKAIEARRKAEGCGVCKVVSDKELEITRLGSRGQVWVGAYPAPARNYSMLVTLISEQGCTAKVSDLTSENRRAFADGLKLAVQLYRQMFGETPAYNIAVRSSDAVGHLHAEIIPKTRTNIPAGFEDTTLEFSLSENPEHFASIAREEVK